MSLSHVLLCRLCVVACSRVVCRGLSTLPPLAPFSKKHDNNTSTHSNIQQKYNYNNTNNNQLNHNTNILNSDTAQTEGSSVPRRMPDEDDLTAADLKNQILFLGYGSHCFEVELLPGAVQNQRAINNQQTANNNNITPSSPNHSSSASSTGHPRPSIFAAPSSSRFSPDALQPSSSTSTTPTAASASSQRFIDPTNAANFLRSSTHAVIPSSHMRVRVERSSVLVYANALFCWSPSIWEEVTVDTLRIIHIITPKPGLLLFGSGRSTRQLSPEVHNYLKASGVKFEVMDTGNASAMYNVLVDEGRQVMGCFVQCLPIVNTTRSMAPSHALRRKLGYGIIDEKSLQN